MRAALIGAVIAALATLPGLGNGTLWDNSETAYGEVAREILLTRDWVVLHFNGGPWFVQPPLYFWLAALSVKFLGLTSFALRLPSALATIAMAALTAYAVARQLGVRAGLYASMILSTCLLQAILGRLAIMDALLDLAVAATIFWWFRAVQTGAGKYFVYGWIAAGLGFLAKGPVAPVAALLVMVPYYLWERRASHARLPGARAWLAGLLLFVVVAAPYFAILWSRAGSGALAELLGHYTFGRYVGTIENQGGPLWYYVPVLILAFFPWIAFFPSALARGIERLRDPATTTDDRRMQQLVRLALTWIVAPLVFFSFAHTKLPNYIALELPALALLVALYLDTAISRARNRSALISTAAVPVAILLLAIAIVWFSRDNRLTSQLSFAAGTLIWMGAAIFAGSLASFAALLQPGRAPAAPYALAVAMVLAMGFLCVLGLPQAEQFKPMPHLAQVIDRGRQPGDAIAIQDSPGGNALIFYTQPGVYGLATPGGRGDDGMDPRRVICSARRTWLVVPDRQVQSIQTYGRSRRLVTRWGAIALFLYDGRKCD